MQLGFEMSGCLSVCVEKIPRFLHSVAASSEADRDLYASINVL